MPLTLQSSQPSFLKLLTRKTSVDSVTRFAEILKIENLRGPQQKATEALRLTAFRLTSSPLMTRSKTRLLLALTVLLLNGCGDSSQQQKPIKVQTLSEQQVIEYIAEQVYEPGFKELDQSALKLKQSLNQLCRPDIEIDPQLLSQAQINWRDSMAKWRKNRAYQIAPIKSLYVFKQVDIWPVNTLILETMLADSSVQVGNDERSIYGYSAIEYLLFSDYQGKTAQQRLNDPKRCKFLSDLGDDLYQHIHKIPLYWNQANDGAKVQYLQHTGKYYLDQQEVLTNTAAQMLNVLERLNWQHLGVPANFFRGNPDVKKLDNWRSQNSLNNIEQMIVALAKLYGNPENTGLFHLLHAKDEDLALSILEQFEQTLTLIRAQKAPLSVLLLEQIDSVENLFNHIQELQNQLMEMSKQMGLKLVFEEDGD